MSTMERILRLMSEKKASDVYLSARSPALIKINGLCIPINNQLLAADSIPKLLAEVLPAKRLEELTETGELASKRAERVAVMAKERRMPSTKFLIVAGGVAGEVRAEHARKLLIKHGIPEKERVVESDGTSKEVNRFETAWQLPLNVQDKDLKSFDRPSALEPKDLSRAVIVFRTDYL